MTKHDFFTELEQALNTHKDDPATQELLKDLSAHFDEAVTVGKSEEEICTMLGDPSEIAAQYLVFAAEKDTPIVSAELPEAKAELSVSLRSACLTLEESHTDSFTVQVKKWGQITDDPNIKVEHHGFGLRIYQVWAQEFISRLFQVFELMEVYVQIPKSFSGDYDLRVTSGNITARRLSTAGQMKVEQRSGNVKIEAVAADGGMTVHSTSGNINLDDCKGDAEVKVFSGNIKVTGHHGTISAIGKSGNVNVQTDRITKTSLIETKSGNLKFEVQTLDAPLRLNCKSGNIKFEVDHVHANITGQTISGNIAATFGADTTAVFQNQFSGFKNEFASAELPPVDLPVISLSTKSGNVKIRRK